MSWNILSPGASKDLWAQNQPQGQKDCRRFLDEHQLGVLDSDRNDVRQEELDLLLVQVIATPYLWLPMVFAHRWFYSKPWTIALSRIRLCDKNTIDVAQLRLALDDFMKKVSALFLQRKAGVIQSYTRHATSLQPLLSDVDRIELPELSLDVP